MLVFISIIKKYIKSVLLSALIFSSPFSQACQLTIASMNLEPIYWKTNKQITGINPDFYRHIGKKINCEITFKIMPWNRVLRDFEAGNVDIITAFYKKDREQFARYSSAPIDHVKFYLFAHPNSSFYPSISDFFAQNQTLLYPENWYLGGLKSQLLSHPNNTHTVTNINKGIELLIANRADAFLSSKLSIDYSTHQKNVRQLISIKSPVLAAIPIYTLFSKKNIDDKMYHKINEAINHSLQNNVMENIVKHYTQ